MCKKERDGEVLSKTTAVKVSRLTAAVAACSLRAPQMGLEISHQYIKRKSERSAHTHTHTHTNVAPEHLELLYQNIKLPTVWRRKEGPWGRWGGSVCVCA